MFPRYITSFPCQCSDADAVSRILSAAEQEGKTVNVKEVDNSQIKKVTLSATTGELSYHNSFLPVVCFEVREVSQGSHISVSVELQRGTKIVMSLFFGFLFGLELLFIGGVLTQLIMINWFILLPLGMMLLSYLMTLIGLKRSSKPLLGRFYPQIVGTESEGLPMLKLELRR